MPEDESMPVPSTALSLGKGEEGELAGGGVGVGDMRIGEIPRDKITSGFPRLNFAQFMFVDLSVG